MVEWEEWEEGGDVSHRASKRARASEGGASSSSSVAAAAAAAAASPGAGKARASADDKSVALAIHQEHVMLMVSRAVVLNAWCEDAGVRSAAAYLVDPSVCGRATVRSAGGGVSAKSVGSVREMLAAFDAAVGGGGGNGQSVGPGQDVGAEAGSAEDLMCGIACRELGGAESVARVQALVAVWRQLGVPARLVAGLDPAPVKPGKDGVLQGKVPQGAVAWWAEVWCRAADAAAGTGGAAAAAQQQQHQQHRWVHVGVADGVVDAPERVRAGGRGLGGGRPYPYVVGFEASGRARDVTRRYCARYHQDVVPLRGPEDWFQDLVASFGGANPSARPPPAAAKDREQEREAGERAEMAVRKADEGLPSNQAAFKAHPLYALEKLLKKSQVIWPREPVVGYFAGLPVYPREHVRDLKSAAAWIRESLRQVKAGEVPLKTFKKRSQGRQAAADKAERTIARAVAAAEAGREYASHVASEAEREVGLFGEWQTEPWVRPAAVDGRVPRNVFGNVECWTPDHVPTGCVHVRHARAAAACARLGVDHALAVVAFEVKAGRTVPKYDGAVICKEAADFVGDALAQDDAVRAEKERERKARDAVNRWRVLVKALTIRAQLQHDFYGTKTPTPGPGRRRPQAAEAAAAPKAPAESHAGGGHTHVWSAEARDPATGLWRRSCACGLSVDFEKM